MQYNILGLVSGIVQYWQHRNDVPFEQREQPSIPDKPPIKTNIEGLSNGRNKD